MVSPRFCPWSFTLHYVHHFSQYSHFLLFPKQSSLCRWHLTLPLLPSNSLWLQHRSPSKCCRSNFVLDCHKCSYSELFSKTEFLLIGLSKQLAKINNSWLCLKPRLHIQWTPHVFWPDLICLKIIAITIFVSFTVSVHNLTTKQLLPSPLKAAISSHITAILRSLHWPKITALNTSCFHLRTKFSQPPTFISAWPCHSSASSQYLLFIFGHTCSSICIIFSRVIE